MTFYIEDYCDQWPQQFEHEAEKIRGVFGAELIEIYHIGSTSVPGLKAKPIIDMLPVVHSIEKVEKYNEKMEELGYECMGEFGIGGRRYFRKGREQRTHHVHIFSEINAKDIQRHIAFRDYLRANAEVAAQYSALKTSLAALHPNDIVSYMDGKDDFVKSMERKAVAWYTEREKNRPL